MASYRQYVKARQVLQTGGVIAYPTEAVYGYGCDPFNQHAVAHLLAIKQRPWQKGLILIAANTRQIAPLMDSLTADQRCRVESAWPGPVTWLLPDPYHWIPASIKGKFSSVAVRVTDHPVAKKICELWGGPVVSTSANRSGEQPCYSELALRIRLQGRQAAEQPDMIVSGPTSGLAKPSAIRDLLSGETLRA
ncbi:MAG: tRNA threonylcarbamoyladenosine biosynthesis protein RimN [Gammaproteobacteria bacterium]|nr:MAG: tRNA threonylcarbamoyladenosine biosynthesis protein RimN [Gammaproteobacteria bacterium]